MTEIAPGKLVTTRGTVTGRLCHPGHRGVHPALPGLHRAVIPVYSLMIATSPLPDSVWEAVGLAPPTFSDGRHLLIYGQRTADGRFAFGGRGAPYHLGSAVRPSFDRAPAVFAALRRTLANCSPPSGM